MIYSVTGVLKHIDLNFVVVECNGVGFKCNASVNTISQLGDLGDVVTLFTYLAVKEDAIELYGFSTPDEHECYLKLISVSGVGPKAAIAILSKLSPAELANAIVTENVKSITAAQGVGPKVAQRIILELKSKFSATSSVSTRTQQGAKKNIAGSTNELNEAVTALEALGYSHIQAVSAVNGIDSTLPASQIIKLALKNLM
ncbi:MAG: Holliday junction branch migration protein RuvA [Clostridia bacterium]|nr:Holliday junction branch migration protein RuvA [Clostridia bacterium]